MICIDLILVPSCHVSLHENRVPKIARTEMGSLVRGVHPSQRVEVVGLTFHMFLRTPSQVDSRQQAVQWNPRPLCAREQAFQTARGLQAHLKDRIRPG
jgi:hypothetical protein